MPSPSLVLTALRDGSFPERLTWRTMRRFLPRLSERRYEILRMKAHAASKLGRWPNTERPETYNDHVLANLIAHERGLLKDFVTDKEFAKIYVRAKCPDMGMPETYAVLRSVEEIMSHDFVAPCMVKPTHSSGAAIAYRGGAIDRSEIVRQLKLSYYDIAREPQYKRLEHKIIVEELLPWADGPPPDWKVHCFFGEPKLIWIISGRGTKPRSRYYSVDWTPLPISSLYPLDETVAEKPSCLESMLGHAKAIAADFRFCRVDMYVIEGKIYFGEITPYSGGASQPWRHAGAASSLDVDRALAPLFETADADPLDLLSRAGLMPEDRAR
jgi:hypothetical protein